jgi:RecB family exonuclease
MVGGTFMFINKVSPSKIKVYDECKLKYKFKYIDYLPEKDTNTDALQFGSYIHKIFEDGVKAPVLSRSYGI